MNSWWTVVSQGLAVVLIAGIFWGVWDMQAKLTTIEVNLKTAIALGDDHEIRIRVLEAKKN